MNIAKIKAESLFDLTDNEIRKIAHKKSLKKAKSKFKGGKWQIDDYDGQEWVSECHRTWK